MNKVTQYHMLRPVENIVEYRLDNFYFNRMHRPNDLTHIEYLIYEYSQSGLGHISIIAALTAQEYTESDIKNAFKELNAKLIIHDIY